MCGGFTCSKNTLVLLNIFYVLVGVLLIAVAGFARASLIVTSLTLVSGIIFCGIFLLLISIVGLIGASKQHQVMLFIYMVVLFFIFIVQFSVACACLAFNNDQKVALASHGWRYADDGIKKDTQQFFKCCGFNVQHKNLSKDDADKMGHPSCIDVVTKKGDLCCPKVTQDNLCCTSHVNSTCSPNRTFCAPALETVIDSGLSYVGSIGLLFSFTELIGFIVAKRFRLLDPHDNTHSLIR